MSATKRGAKADQERAEVDKRWDAAVDWLLNSRHTADPGIQNAFWGIVDGRHTPEDAEYMA